MAYRLVELLAESILTDYLRSQEDCNNDTISRIYSLLQCILLSNK